MMKHEPVIKQSYDLKRLTENNMATATTNKMKEIITTSVLISARVLAAPADRSERVVSFLTNFFWVCC